LPYVDFLAIAQARYSLRRYDPRPVPREVLERCLEAARLAPSACNGQPWRFFVADREPMRGRLAEAAFGGPYRMNSFAAKAPVLVVVVSTPLPWTARIGQFIGGVPFAPCDAAVATEHLILQGASEGVGSCWLGFFNFKAVGSLLNLPGDLRPLFMVAMGYPPEGLGVPERVRRPAEEVWTFLQE
jgi:nitroreductase